MNAIVGPVTVVIPVKDPCAAKQRLASLLTAEQRTGLFEAMLRDVIAAVLGAEGVAEVYLVGCEPAVGQLAAGQDIRVLVEPSNRGHTAAVRFAVDALADRGVGHMLTLPADVPLTDADEVTALIRAHRPGPSISIAPARDRMGSNAVLCTPPGALDFRFGDNSFYPHLRSARAAGIEPRIVALPGIGLDIDRPADLALLAADASDTHTYRFLQHNGLLERCFAAAV